MYINGVVFGSVIADEQGVWRIKFQSSETSVLAQFQSCINDVCSLTTDPIRVNFAIIAGACSIDFSLTQYRFWNNNSSVIELQPVVGKQIEGVLEVVWGDSNVEKFNLQDTLGALTYKYPRRGYYNGKAVFAINESCTAE